MMVIYVHTYRFLQCTFHEYLLNESPQESTLPHTFLHVRLNTDHILFKQFFDLDSENSV